MKNYYLIIFIFAIGIFYFYRNNIKNYFKNIINRINENFTSLKCNKEFINVNPNQPTTPTFYYQQQKDFNYHSENIDNDKAEELYNVLQTMILPNKQEYSLTMRDSKKYKVSKKEVNTIIDFIKTRFENVTKIIKIKNITNDKDIFYFKNVDCLEIQPFQISGYYYHKNKLIGKVKLQLELSFSFNQPNDIFLNQQVSFAKYNGVFQFNRITLINHYFDKKNKKTLPILIDKIPESNTYDFNYNNKESFDNLDTINSLIPNDIDITED